MSSKQETNHDFIKKIHPRLYGLISTLLGLGLAVVTIRYVQDNGFFDFSEGITIMGLLATPIFSAGTFALLVGGLFYLIKGKWIENKEGSEKVGNRGKTK